MRNAQCTCPHHYTAVGLQRFGTDACCPAHGAPKAPEPVVSRPVDVSTCAKGHWYDDGVCVHCGADEL